MTRAHERVETIEVTGMFRLGKHARIQQQQRDGKYVEAQLGGAPGGASAEALAEATQLTAEDSGKTYYLKNAAGFAVTLPAPAMGLSFRFVASVAPAGGSYAIVSDGGADIVKGAVQEAGAATGPASQAGDTVTLADGVALIGDQVVLECDGDAWLLSGSTAADNAVIISAT